LALQTNARKAAGHLMTGTISPAGIVPAHALSLRLPNSVLAGHRVTAAPAIFFILSDKKKPLPFTAAAFMTAR
jgi:hypothetical protein